MRFLFMPSSSAFSRQSCPRSPGRSRRKGRILYDAPMRVRIQGPAILLALALGGCVSLPQSDALRDQPPADLPPRVELAQVPFHAQEDNLCGPASLAMAFNAADVPASVESLTPQVYLPGRKGSLQAEMLGATRRAGLVAYTTPPRLEALLRDSRPAHPWSRCSTLA